jgi:hypothetical protein
LSANFRLEWKWLAETNALAYGTAELITTEKSFTEQAPDDNFKNCKKLLMLFLEKKCENKCSVSTFKILVAEI